VAFTAPLEETRELSDKSELQLIRAPSLCELPGFVHGFSTRLGGVSVAYGGGQL